MRIQAMARFRRVGRAAGWLMGALLAGCGFLQPTVETARDTATMHCRQVFPELDQRTMCTMQYDPVCARMPTDERRTFSNACQACVGGAATYEAGQCERQEPAGAR